MINMSSESNKIIQFYIAKECSKFFYQAQNWISVRYPNYLYNSRIFEDEYNVYLQIVLFNDLKRNNKHISEIVRYIAKTSILHPFLKINVSKKLNRTKILVICNKPIAE